VRGRIVSSKEDGMLLLIGKIMESGSSDF
jgi:hypothetical protein